jgi:hypothetical protein
MAEKESATKLWIDGFAAFATFMAIVIGVWQFNEQQESNLQAEISSRKYNDALEFKRNSWERQHNIYLDIVGTVGAIVSEYSNRRTKDSAIAQFKLLYYGRAAFVEDSPVETAMKRFAEDIDDYLNGFLSQNDLKLDGLNLVDKCKQSSSNTWHALSEP